MGRMIVVREIMTHMWISWIKLILGNTLLYMISVCDFPGPGSGILCILFVGIFSRSAQVGFSLLCASNY